MAERSPASSAPGTPACCCQAALTRQLVYGRQTLEFKCSESQLTRVHMWLYMIHLVTCQNVADTCSSSCAGRKCTASPVVSVCVCTQSAQACLHGSSPDSSYLLHASVMGTLLVRLDSVKAAYYQLALQQSPKKWCHQHISSSTAQSLQLSCMQCFMSPGLLLQAAYAVWHGRTTTSLPLPVLITSFTCILGTKPAQQRSEGMMPLTSLSSPGAPMVITDYHSLSCCFMPAKAFATLHDICLVV